MSGCTPGNVTVPADPERVRLASEDLSQAYSKKPKRFGVPESNDGDRNDDENVKAAGIFVTPAKRPSGAGNNSARREDRSGCSPIRAELDR